MLEKLFMYKYQYQYFYTIANILNSKNIIHSDIHANINKDRDFQQECSSSIDAKTRANTISDMTKHEYMNVHISANLNVSTNTKYNHQV